MDDIETEISLWESALASYPEYSRETDPSKWADLHRYLGNAYQSRRLGDRAANVETAIEHYQLALEVHTKADFPENWATAHANLGLAYVKRLLGSRGENLQNGIRHDELALQVLTRDAYPNEWAGVHNNMGIAYLDLLRGDETENLRRAKEHFEFSLEVLTQKAAPADWAQTHQNLGNLYGRWLDGDQEDNLDLSIKHSEQALEVYTREAAPRNWASVHMNLGVTYRKRRRGGRALNVQSAIEHYRMALEVRSLEAMPLDRCRTLRNLGNLQFEERQWADALDAYTQAITAADVLLTTAGTDASRLAEVGQSWGLHTLSAYCLLRQGELESAFLRLEEGKTRILTQHLFLAEGRSATRGRPNHDTSDTTELAIPDIVALAPVGGALIAPLVTPQGSAAFVLPSGMKKLGSDHVVWIDDFTEASLKMLLLGTEHDPGILGAYLSGKRQGGSLREFLDVLEPLLGRLWEQFVRPLHNRLTHLGVKPDGQLILLPQGGLGSLSLHAAWRIEGGTKRAWCDDLCVSYAPSASTLRVCQQRVARHEPVTPRLLAVVDPTADLPYARAEGEVVRRLFPAETRTVLIGPQASRTTITREAAGRTFLHFACHGYFWPDAAQSGLVVAGDGSRPPFSGVPSVPWTIPQEVANLLGLESTYLPVSGVAGDALTVSEIVAGLHIQNSRLVTLSACESGLTQPGPLADEQLGLPAAFLEAGACGVLSTLWAVNDLSTLLAIETFYTSTLGGTPMPEALRRAQQWLRNVSSRELAARFRAELDATDEVRTMSYEECSTAWRRFAAMDPEERPFVHPYYWAPFVFIGA